MSQQLSGVYQMSPAMRGFVAMLRDFMRDHPELNRLIAGKETGDRMMAWAVMDAISDFNGTPPLTQYSLEQLLQYQLHSLLLRMAACSVLESVGLLQTRNHINASNGGINSGISDKTPFIMNWIQVFRGYTEQRKGNVKVALNIKSILGDTGVHSELWYVNQSYISY